jgi:hypothetical protein
MSEKKLSENHVFLMVILTILSVLSLVTISLLLYERTEMRESYDRHVMELRQNCYEIGGKKGKQK